MCRSKNSFMMNGMQSPSRDIFLFEIPPTSSLIRYKKHSRRVVGKIGKWKKWWWTDENRQKRSPNNKKNWNKHGRRLTSSGLHMTSPPSNIMRPATKCMKNTLFKSCKLSPYFTLSWVVQLSLKVRMIWDPLRGGALHLRPDGGKSFIFPITRVWNIRLHLLRCSARAELRHAAPAFNPQIFARHVLIHDPSCNHAGGKHSVAK